MLTVCTTSQAYFESPENKKISKCCFMGGSQNRPQFTWAASGDAPEREARPLPTMTHIVFRWWTSLKSKAPPPQFEPHLKWGSLFVSSWKNILRVGGWIRTVTNCCRYGVKHLEVRGVREQSERCGILPGQSYVRGWADRGQRAKSHTVRQTDRERERREGERVESC